MDIIQNPVVIGVLVGLITYVYMIWSTNQNKKKKKQHKKYGNGANLPIVLVVSCIAWFIAYSYFDTDTKKSIVNTTIQAPFVNNIQRFNPAISTSSDQSFSLLQNGINIPNTLPDLALPDTMLEMN
jgi:hypothetical protein